MPTKRPKTQSSRLSSKTTSAKSRLPSPRPTKRQPPAQPASRSTPPHTPGAHDDVILRTLENGLTLIIREDHSAPVVSAQAWCRAGSIDEGRLLGAGLSHVLEHMLFKGTAHRSGTRIDQEVQEAGGYMNAYTSFDRTVYWINVPNTGAKVALDVLCDIMQHASIPEEELAKELDVIRREMDMGQDDPGSKASRRLFETAYTRSPYRFPIIGHADIFNSIQRQDIVSYYREKYAPNNLFFVVVGDIQAQEVIDQIQTAFSKTPARAVPSVPLPTEPKQTGPRELIEEAAIELGHFHYSWHIPDLRHSDIPALDVLAVLLGGGRSSRLYQEVREKKGIVNAVDAWTYNPGNPGLFGASAVVNSDQFTPARAGILHEIERMKAKPVSPAELQKAVKQFIAGTLASRKTMQGQAQDLGSSWLAANDLSFSERYLVAVQKLKPADLQRVARHYLTEENRTLYALLPKGGAPQTTSVSSIFSSHHVQKHILPNGLTVLLKEDSKLPFVEYRVVLRGGVLAETPRTSGLTLLAAKMLLQGTRSRSAETIAREIESVGGSISTYGGNNSFGVNAETLSSDLHTGLNLVADVLLRPTFPAPALERERQIQLAEIKSQKDHLLSLADAQAREALFGNQGYGLHARGTESSVGSLQLKDLQAFHKSMVVPSNTVIAVFGDIQAGPTLALIKKLFGSWSTSQRAPISNPTCPPLTKIQRVSTRVDKKQAVLVISFPGSQLTSPDRFALELVQEALSDLGSRLFIRIRDELGLAYYVGATNFIGLIPGYFGFYVGTDPDKADLVERELLSEAHKLYENGLTEAELLRAKAKIVGQKKIARQEVGRLATAASLDELYGLGYDYSEHEDSRYEAVTLHDVREVCRRYLKPDAYVISLVAPSA